MTNEEKIIAAIQKSGLHFNYLIMCDDNGRPIGIKNRDVYSSIFGKHTNDYNQNLDLDPVSKMTISDITIEILKKWGMSKKLTASQAAATLGRMTSERKKKTSAENGRKSKNGGRPKRGAYSLELVYDSGAMVNVDSGFDTLAEAVEALNKRPPVPNGTTLITRGDGVFYDCDGKRVYR
jgi:hypothetical protein